MHFRPVGPANLTRPQISPQEAGFLSQTPNFQRNFRQPAFCQTLKFPKEFPEMYASPIPYKEWEHSGLHRVTGTEQVPAEADPRGSEQAVRGF